jgi:uncharacterized protein YqjF (DUF2071 family)
MNATAAIPPPTSSLSEAARSRMLSLRGEPVLYADWLRAVFIHFEVDAEALQRKVPFELDLDDGRAYVSLVAFSMQHMRPRIGGKLAAALLKPIASHDFLNLRAYVRHGSKTGIYFLAEWLSNPLSLALGPPVFGLPYRCGRLEYQHQHEKGRLQGSVFATSREQTGQGRAALRYEARIETAANFSPCPAGSRDEFLLERYVAFTSHYCRRFFRIWHPPWPQVPVDVALSDTSLLNRTWPWFREAKVIGANYSPGIRGVWMGRPRFTGI